MPNIKIQKSSLIMGLIFLVVLGTTGGLLLGELRTKQMHWRVHPPQDSVLRLHVIASSDSPEDQALKKEVVLQTRQWLGKQGSFASIDDFLNFINQALPGMEEEIRTYVQKSSPREEVTLTLTRSNFPLRAYGTQIFSPGQYTALKIVLGKGEGENWWCLLFPPLCLTLAEPQNAEEPAAATACVVETTGPKKVHWRFKFWEWLKKWF